MPFDNDELTTDAILHIEIELNEECGATIADRLEAFEPANGFGLHFVLLLFYSANSITKGNRSQSNSCAKWTEKSARIYEHKT